MRRGFRSGPDTIIACSAKPNGNMPRARAPTPPVLVGQHHLHQECELRSGGFPRELQHAGKISGQTDAGGRSYPANPFGLSDMSGNLWQWTEDCWNESYARAPTHGEAWRTGDCNRRVVRGGAFNNKPEYARSAFRFWEVGDVRIALVGFRVWRGICEETHWDGWFFRARRCTASQHHWDRGPPGPPLGLWLPTRRACARGPSEARH